MKEIFVANLRRTFDLSFRQLIIGEGVQQMRKKRKLLRLRQLSKNRN